MANCNQLKPVPFKGLKHWRSATVQSHIYKMSHHWHLVRDTRHGTKLLDSCLWKRHLQDERFVATSCKQTHIPAVRKMLLAYESPK